MKDKDIEISKKLQEYENKKESEITKQDFTFFDSLSKSCNSEIRNEIAEILALFPCKLSENILLQLINDEDELVRVNACDSLFFSTSVDTLKLLLKKAEHETWLVRMYAVLSIGDITCSIDSHLQRYKVSWLLERMLKVEKSETVHLSYYISLVKLGKRRYNRNLPRFIDF